MENKSRSLNHWVETFLLIERAKIDEEVKQVRFEQKRFFLDQAKKLLRQDKREFKTH